MGLQVGVLVIVRCLVLGVASDIELITMGLPQWFNGSGAFVALRAVLGARASVVPHLRARDITDVDFEALRRAGVTAVVFDKDNTLTHP